MTELVNFIFHIMKISNFRHKLAFKQVVRFFKVLQYISVSEDCVYLINSADSDKMLLMLVFTIFF